MARNKTSKPLTEAPPEPESSSDQISGSSTEPEDVDPAEQEVSSASSSSADEEDDDDDEKQQTPYIRTTTTTPPPSFSPPSKKSTTQKKPTSQPLSSSSSEESDSDNEVEVPLKSKPNSKPIVEPKPRSKPIEKRPAETEKEKPTSKRAKKDNSKTPGLSPGPGSSLGPNEEVSKKLFQRVFSEEDEVEILKGMIEFKDRKGEDPMKNDDEFYGFVKKKLHTEVNKAQVVDKVKRLKRKFANAKKSKKKIVNEHEKKLFELSNKVWEVNEDEGDVKVNGNNNAGGAASVTKLKISMKEKEKEKDNVSDGGKSGLKDKSLKGDNGAVEEKKKKSKEEESEAAGEIDECFKIGEGELKEVMRAEALKRMGEKGRAEIKEMWRKVEIAQLEVDLMRNEARVKENRMIMEALGLVKK